MNEKILRLDNLKVKKSVGEGCEWEDNIKTDLRDKGCQNSEVTQEYVHVTKMYKLILQE
jgi:hypothetical protein